MHILVRLVVVAISGRLKQEPAMDRHAVCHERHAPRNILHAVVLADFFNVLCCVLHPAAAASLQAMLGTYNHSQNQYSMQA